MAERSLIHKTQIKAFFKFVSYEKLLFRLPPENNEVARFQSASSVITFHMRGRSDHLTTYGYGTELAKAFIKHQKEKSIEKDLFPANRAGSDERRSNSVR